MTNLRRELFQLIMLRLSQKYKFYDVDDRVRFEDLIVESKHNYIICEYREIEFYFTPKTIVIAFIYMGYKNKPSLYMIRLSYNSENKPNMEYEFKEK